MCYGKSIFSFKVEKKLPFLALRRVQKLQKQAKRKYDFHENKAKNEFFNAHYCHHLVGDTHISYFLLQWKRPISFRRKF